MVAPASSPAGAFTPLDSLLRLQRVQSVCRALGVDGMLFVGGVDGRDNIGSVQALNYLLGGVSGFDLLERQQPSGLWAEDVVLLVRPTSCEIHVGPSAYASVQPLVAHWGDVTVHTLPPRHLPDDSKTAASAASASSGATPNKFMTTTKKDVDDDDDDDKDGYDSDGSDDEDVLQDFKLTALVTMLTGTRKIAVALTPAAGGAGAASSSSSSSSSSSAAGMEVEKWPLLQAGSSLHTQRVFARLKEA